MCQYCRLCCRLPQCGGYGCAGRQCRGYELVKNLDFDTDGNGQIDKGDAYWNDGDGWSPIGEVSSPFNYENVAIIRRRTAGDVRGGLVGGLGRNTNVGRQ